MVQDSVISLFNKALQITHWCTCTTNFVLNDISRQRQLEWFQIEGFRRLTPNLADSPDASRLRICRCGGFFLDSRSSKCVISARSWLSTTPPLLNPNRNVGGHFLIFRDDTAGGDVEVGPWVLKTFSFASGCLPSAIRSRWLGRSSVHTFTCQSTHVKVGLVAQNQQKIYI